MGKRLLFAIMFTAISSIIAETIAYQFVFAPPPINENDPFNLIFKYGIGAKNELFTFNNSFTKDLVSNGTITTTLVLSKEELYGIQQKIIELNVFSYPDSFPLHPFYHVDPKADFYIRIQNGDRIKEVSWNSESLIENNMQEKLDQLKAYIITSIEQKPEYKALPTPSGGYL
jgi:hypothetical protein